MLIANRRRSLSRRGSKLLVEMIIGVIGILGIMLAQNSAYHNSQAGQLVDHNGKIIKTEVARMTSKIDWLDILF